MPTAAGAAGHVLLLLLGVLCRTSVSLPTRLSRQSQHYENGPIPSFQQPFQQSPQAQAFASKLASPIDASQQLSPHQFVANNGPLIRAPDGQFVLAPIGQNQQPIAQFPAQTGGPPFAGQQPLFGQQPPQQQFIPQQPFQQQFGQPFPAQPQQFAQNSNSNAAAQPLPPTPIPPTGPPAAIGIADNNSSSSSNASSSPPTTPPSAPPSSTAPPPPVDKSVDLDGDGALSLSEVQYAAFVHHGLSSSVVENLFNEVDHNKDGYLNSLEFNDIRSLVLAKAENAALRYLQNVDSDHNGMLSLQEAQNYILREYGISNRDVERIWRLVVPSSNDEMDAVLFSKLRRRVRGMSIRLARQIMKGADRDEDGHVNLREAQLIAFEQEGIGPGEVVEMLASVDDNNDGELNAPEFADFERIVRARAVETSKKALKVVDTDGSGTLTMDEAKKIAFDHYGFDEATLEPFFAQADENEDGQLDAVEFAGFRSVIRGRAVKNALSVLPEADEDGDGMVSETEAEARTRREDDMSAAETHGLFAVADQDKNGQLDKVELADFVRLVRLTSIKFVADHFRDYDSNRDKLVTLDELEKLVKDRYKLEPPMTRKFFDRVDVDRSGDLSPGEIVDFRHEIRRFAQDRVMQAELEEQNKREMAEIEAKLRKEAEARRRMEGGRTETGEEEGNNLPAEGRRETEQQVAVETSTGRKETAEEGEEDGEEVEAGEGEEQGRRAEEQREVETGRRRNSTASEDAAGKERVLGEQRPRPGGEAAPATAINSQHANGTAGTSPQPQASTQTAAIETPSTTQISTAAAIAPQASAAPPQQLPTAQSSPSPSPSQPSPTSSPASSTQPVASSSAIPIPSLSPNAQIGPNNATLANGGTQTVGEQRSIGESQQGQGVVPVGQQLQSGGPSTVGATSKRQRKRRRKAKTTTTAPTTTTTTETYDDEEEGAEEDGEEAENNEQN